MTGRPYPRQDCYFCQSEDNLETHHVFPSRFGGTDDPANLVDVCRKCHRKLERVYDNRFYFNIGVRNSDHRPVFDAKEIYWADTDPHHAVGDLHLYCPDCHRGSLATKVMWGPLGKNGLQCFRCGALVIGPTENVDSEIINLSDLEAYDTIPTKRGFA